MFGVVDDDSHPCLLLCDMRLKEAQQVVGVDAAQRFVTAAVEEVSAVFDHRLTLLNAEMTSAPDDAEEVAEMKGSVNDAIDV